MIVFNSKSFKLINISVNKPDFKNVLKVIVKFTELEKYWF